MKGLNYFLNAFSKQKFFNSKGRARQTEYGWFMLISWAILRSLELFESFSIGYAYLPMTDVFYSLPWAFIIISLIPSIAMIVHRLNDLGYSGWWLLLYQIIGFFFFLINSWFIAYCGCQNCKGKWVFKRWNCIRYYHSVIVSPTVAFITVQRRAKTAKETWRKSEIFKYHYIRKLNQSNRLK